MKNIITQKLHLCILKLLRHNNHRMTKFVTLNSYTCVIGYRKKGFSFNISVIMCDTCNCFETLVN